MFAASIKVDQPESGGPLGWIRGLGTGQGCQAAEGLVLEGSMNVQIPESCESRVVCVCVCVCFH